MTARELALYRAAMRAAYIAMRPAPSVGRWRPEIDESAAWALTELIVGIAKRYAASGAERRNTAAPRDERHDDPEQGRT